MNDRFHWFPLSVGKGRRREANNEGRKQQWRGLKKGEGLVKL